MEDVYLMTYPIKINVNFDAKVSEKQQEFRKLKMSLFNDNTKKQLE